MVTAFVYKWHGLLAGNGTELLFIQILAIERIDSFLLDLIPNQQICRRRQATSSPAESPTKKLSCPTSLFLSTYNISLRLIANGQQTPPRKLELEQEQPQCVLQQSAKSNHT